MQRYRLALGARKGEQRPTTARVLWTLAHGVPHSDPVTEKNMSSIIAEYKFVHTTLLQEELQLWTSAAYFTCRFQLIVSHGAGSSLAKVKNKIVR